MNVSGGLLEDSSQTYALIRSPGAAIVQGTDYDIVGAYEDDTNQAFGIVTDNEGNVIDAVGVLDALPAGAQVVDSVGVVEGGGGDQDRTLAPPELGNPGVHVHQPVGLPDSGNVTSDAVSRRVGQTLPNSIGVWFNGDVAEGSLVGSSVPYINDSFVISVVAPDGAVLTPGAPNVLRNVFFNTDDQNVRVAEADGSVTVSIERTGDIANESIEVTYRTVDFGSAIEDIDYEGVEETITFAAGESSKDITINLLSDSDAEGFERFQLEITGVTNLTDADLQYLITNGRPNQSGAINGLATVTIEDANVSIATFQNGTNGYQGTQDAFITGLDPFDRFGQASTVEVDSYTGTGEDLPDDVRPQQGLIRFDNLTSQIPAGSTIFDAFLTVNVTGIASGADINFFRMLQDWNELTTSWNNPNGSAGGSIVNGITPDNTEAASIADGTVANAGRAGMVDIQLDPDTIQSWINDPNGDNIENFGWAIISDSPSLWRFDSSEAFLLDTFRPQLTVLYTDPVAEDTGVFSLSTDEVKVNEINDFEATFTINRIGGSSGAATVNWDVTPGTGQLADVGNASGTVQFADGELAKTFTVSLVDDNIAETTESLNVTISGNGLDFDRDTSTLTIRDDDFDTSSSQLLLNEIWINSPGNDPPHEFVELKGDASIPLGSVYYVAVEGLVGDRTGQVEKVVDLGEFASGSSGFTILTPDADGFAFNVPAGTTQIDRLGSIENENVASQNDSTTYMLVFSPAVDLTTASFDYDWNDSGNLELLSLPGVEIIDSLGVRVLDPNSEAQIYGPTSNQAQFAAAGPEVDAVSRSRNSTSRNAGAQWFGGDLEPGGDDYLLYEPEESFGLPVTGAALSPGEANVGTNAESPLISLIGQTANPDGTISLTFSAPVSQNNLGDGGTESPQGAGITLTDSNGVDVAGVSRFPTVTGFFTDTLTLTFTGGAVNNGQLPQGTYQLNVVGNAITGNGRAVDASNDGTAIDSSQKFTVEVGAGGDLDGDFNGDGAVDAGDYVVWRDNQGATEDANVLSGNGDGVGTVDEDDYQLWRANLGNVASGSTTITPVDDSASAGLAAAFAGLGEEEVAETGDDVVRRGSGMGRPNSELLLRRFRRLRDAGDDSSNPLRERGSEDRGDATWADATDEVFAGLRG